MASSQRNLERLRALGIIEPENAEPQASVDVIPDFDGGVREPAPPPADRAREHDQTVLEVVQRLKWGGPW